MNFFFVKVCSQGGKGKYPYKHPPALGSHRGGGKSKSVGPAREISFFKKCQPNNLLVHEGLLWNLKESGRRKMIGCTEINISDSLELSKS